MSSLVQAILSLAPLSGIYHPGPVVVMVYCLVQVSAVGQREGQVIPPEAAA
jgi:hypothetical protein